ncbi:hypothetical protein Kpol_1053p9 [Vanderwaltozyma polyspora DSM 70294]|uniref:Uncharacterized protein n=1 Tax=Vanderwaltozyma polyspora (strain ATCC 22028 / DSM 70294 / BCRC 21397 / CBS 2163 / NBRC 10782 / NRRL Y-8283 / UCD 57-17) TaxID=436907 RepID=A7TN55_VANPO|nr:uncharacterized protein Kpol_1053p9 [Vanderwaltozyma polyspora DSM 70294]EDO16273.1 hypothetical protein Kpol_1053p9 [Vanderwaltozyma polyspora DSM 70294]
MKEIDDTELNSIRYLLGILRSTRIKGTVNNGDEKLNQALLNNVVYYTARIRSIGLLNEMVDGIFNSQYWNNYDLLELQEMVKGIFQWKLEISEPVVPIDTFCAIWNSYIVGCKSWSVYKIAIVAGALDTQDKFESLQSSIFVDDSGSVRNLYETWRSKYYIPIWNDFIRMYTGNGNDLVRKLMLSYSAISRESDNNFGVLPWQNITIALTNLSSDYITSKGIKESQFMSRNMNKVAKTLLLSIPHCSEQLTSTILAKFCKMCYDLSTVESNNSGSWGNDYSDRHYVNILLTIVLSLKGILESRNTIPVQWYHQVITCLYFIHFIVKDFGISGFESYNYVLNVSVTGIKMAAEKNPKIYMDLVCLMRSNIWGDPKSGNKISISKLLFLLTFLESTISQFKGIDMHFIETIVQPLIDEFIRSSNNDIKESIHWMILSALNTKLYDWQIKLIPQYLDASFTAFIDGELLPNQIILIAQTVSGRIQHLSQLKESMPSETCNYIYSKIQTPGLPNETKKTLIECLIFMSASISNGNILEWLEKCSDLILTSNFDKTANHELISTMWTLVTTMRSKVALKFWYDKLPQLQSKL